MPDCHSGEARRPAPSPGQQIQLTPSHRPAKHPGTGGRPSPPRRDRERHPGPQVRRGTQPSPLGALRRQRSLAGSTGQAHNLARWTARIGLDEGVMTTKTLRRRLFSLAGRITRRARRLILHLPQHWREGSLALWPGCEPCQTAPRASDPSSRLDRLADARRAGPLCLMPLSALLLLPFAAISGCQRPPFCVPHIPHPMNPPGSVQSLTPPPCLTSPPLYLVDSGLNGAGPINRRVLNMPSSMFRVFSAFYRGESFDKIQEGP